MMAAQPQTPVPLPAVSQTDRAILAIRGMLLRGDFEPGERISELPLAARLCEADVKVSRTPLRLALEQLAHEGLLRPWPTGGFVVCEFTQADVWDTIEIRGTLEGTAARMAAERLQNDSELEKLRLLCRHLDELLPVEPTTFGRYLDLNAQFHAELWRLAKSPMLLRTIEHVVRMPFAAPSALVFGPGEARQAGRLAYVAQEHHRALVEAIANREGTRAESLAREHSRVARQNLSRALGDSELLRHMPGAALINTDLREKPL